MANDSGSNKIHREYVKMPKSHKRKFCIGGSPENYREIINWLRGICSSEGGVFKGIPSLNTNLKSDVYPFVQIKVVNLKNKSVKFIICRHDLYLIACKAPHNGKAGFLFGSVYQIDDWKSLDSFDGGEYRTTPWKDIGSDHMSTAVNILLNRDASAQAIKRGACEVFIFHLCEAARFRPVEFIVYRSLALRMALLTNTGFGNQTLEEFQEEEKYRLLIDSGINNEEEEENCTLVGTVSIEKDIYSLIKAVGSNNHSFSDEVLENYLRELVHSYGDLSIIWYTYYLSNKKVFEMESHRSMLARLYMRYRKSVRFTVAILCGLNDRKLLPTLKGKVSDEQYMIIEAKIRELQNSKKI